MLKCSAFYQVYQIKKNHLDTDKPLSNSAAGILTTWFFISNWVKNDLYNANFKKQKKGVHDIHQCYHVLNFESRTSITTTCKHTNRKRYAFLNGNYAFFPISSYSLLVAQRLCLAATGMRERTSEHRISAYGAATLTELNYLSPIHAFLIPAVH